MKRSAVAVVLAVCLLVGVSVLAVVVGAEPISLLRAWTEPSSMDAVVLWLRIPRVALGLLAGAGLSAVGMAFQALLRNPLAEPYVLGVSGGAALGATLAMVAGLTTAVWWSTLAVPLSAIVGGLLATAWVYSMARSVGHGRGTTVVLGGVLVNALASAAITFIKTLVTPNKSQELLMWLMGFLEAPSHPIMLVPLSVVIVVGCGVLMADSGRLNLIGLGATEARCLGVDVAGLERRVYVVSSVIVGAIVSFTGLIGFVGLVVPHVIRRLVGPDHRVGLPLSMIAGATLLVLCDLVSQLLLGALGQEPPVGAVTALLGAPAVLWVLRSRRIA